MFTYLDSDFPILSILVIIRTIQRVDKQMNLHFRLLIDNLVCLILCLRSVVSKNSEIYFGFAHFCHLNI